MYKNLEQYGVIGNLETTAHIGDDGSIDWFCTPFLESPSVFGAILDHEKGGMFAIRPTRRYTSRQQYIDRTNVLQTVFFSEGGEVFLTDFMPPLFDKNDFTGKPRSLFRKVECKGGEADLEVIFKPMFDYGRAESVFNVSDGIYTARGGAQQLFLCSHSQLKASARSIAGRVKLVKGDIIWLILSYDSPRSFTPQECEDHLKSTMLFWKDWAHSCDMEKCVFKGPWHDLVVRAGLTLKLLTYPATGGIAAAPTTSLPEDIGGVRNWDYRYAWIRDSSFTAQALYDLGHKHEALEYFHWFHRIVERKTHPSEIQIMYGLHGDLELPEVTLDHLSGYKNSRPVRIGNKAAKQRQLDIYGELIEAFFETYRYEKSISPEAWKILCVIINYVCEIWNTTDSGIWEVRSEPKHFTHSKLMCWVAVDRGIRMAKYTGYDAPVIYWKKVREEISNAILTHGYNSKLNSFVQSFGSEYMDATALLIPLMEFLPANDQRVQGTVEAVMNTLSHNGMIYRYNGEDGLPGGEGTFLLCTFWLVDVLAMAGRIDKAEELYDTVAGYATPLGLFAEEFDATKKMHLGNYPQGFSHIGLINSALYIGKAKGLRQIGPEPLGFELKEMPA